MKARLCNFIGSSIAGELREPLNVAKFHVDYIAYDINLTNSKNIAGNIFLFLFTEIY